METVFTNMAGTTQFVRDDMEEGVWTQEEYSVNATFPYVSGKAIIRGMRMMFRDPATNNLEVFEVRNVTNVEPEHYQQIIAEHIAIAELSDEHMDEVDLIGIRAHEALGAILDDTPWAVGTVDTPDEHIESAVVGISSAELSRGSVWNGVTTIAKNWNVYIIPRVTTNAAGGITGRYLDIKNARGTWRGVRLSISKNMSDSSVVYDDTDVYTALYGYGGSVEVEQESGDDETETLTFEEETWSSTSDHPAKPYGQKYLEYPEKTALYGRNGRPRFGYYQNGDIKDASILLWLTWDALQHTCDPKISITGTVTDLHRLGYNDEPLRLHDTAIVEIAETGEVFQKEIIKLEVDLVDPSATRPTIGDYVKNIVYINNETTEAASGSGGGGGSGSTNNEYEWSETYSGFEKTNNMIAMVVGTRDGDNYIKAGEIGLSINKSGETGSYESTAYINADHVNISATQTNYSLAGEMERDADGKLIIKSAGGMYVKKTNQGVTAYYGVYDENNLTGGIIVDKVNGATSTYITGDHVNISGTNTVYTLAGNIEVDDTGKLFIKSAGGLYVKKTNQGVTSEFGVYDSGNLTAGVVATIVNGETSTNIYADNILMSSASGANSVKVAIDGKLTTSQLYSKISELTIVDMLAAHVDGNLQCDGGMTAASIAINQNYGITNAGTAIVGAIKLGSASSSFSNCIVSASVSSSGTTLTLTDAEGTDVTFNKAVSLSGDWNGTTYTVSATAGTISGTAPSTSVYLAVEGYANPNDTVYAKVYKDNPNVSTNVLDTVTMTLSEDSTNKKVTLSANSLTKGSISTQNTYNSGRNSVTVSSIEVYGSPAATATSITVKATASNGASNTGSINITSQRNNAYSQGITYAKDGLYIMGANGSSSNKDQRTSATISPGNSITLWPAFYNGSAYVWGTSCTVSASQPTVGSVSAGSASGTSLGTCNARTGQCVRFYVGNTQYYILLT